jgi:pimeloyl-ACP methyl ester carboxylesterase
VVKATIGPAGGLVVGASGLQLAVPAGALSTPTEITLRWAVRNPQVLSLFPVCRCEPAGLMTAQPFTLTLPIAEVLRSAPFDLVAFRQAGITEPWNVLRDTAFDPTAGLLTVTTNRFGDFVGWNGALHRLFTHERATLDPARPASIENFPTGTMLVPNGSDQLVVGRGDADDFWQSDSADNLLVLHGLVGSPTDFLGAEDLCSALSPGTKNILFYLYPSASGVAATANALYNEIALRRLPGFRCSILGHSLGGLVARYLLEKSADDPNRPGYREQDEPLTDAVVNLILLAVPNAGSEIGGALLGTLAAQVPATEQALVQSASDLSFGSAAITMSMNATYFDNPTRYFVLYGEVNGSGSDGVVNVASALALPLFSPETSTRFVAEHNELHQRAGSVGVASRIDTILRTP